MSKLVHEFTHLRLDDGDAGLIEQRRDPAVDHEQLLVLDRAQPVQDDRDTLSPRDVDAVGQFAKQRR